jgi:serine/threonine-protein kinase RsbT
MVRQMMYRNVEMAQQSMLEIRNDMDVMQAHLVTKDIAQRLGFTPMEQLHLATAVSELAINIFLYAGTGNIITRSITCNGCNGIEIEVTDKGPGICNLNQVLRDDYITPRSAWMGLPGARRCMDDFTITSQRGIGTTIVCRKWCMPSN